MYFQKLVICDLSGLTRTFNTNSLILIDPAKMEQSTYLRDLEAQIAEQRARKAQERKEQQADWWEKKTDPAYTLPSPKKPHPSMVNRSIASRTSLLNFIN